jgi:hypothetical protein
LTQNHRVKFREVASAGSPDPIEDAAVLGPIFGSNDVTFVRAEGVALGTEARDKATRPLAAR